MKAGLSPGFWGGGWLELAPSGDQAFTWTDPAKNIAFLWLLEPAGRGALLSAPLCWWAMGCDLPHQSLSPSSKLPCHLCKECPEASTLEAP